MKKSNNYIFYILSIIILLLIIYCLINLTKNNIKEKLDEPELTGELIGTVKWFNSKKGYGFISEDYDEQGFFVDELNIKGENKNLSEGDRVTFNIGKNEIGNDIAINVKKI